MPIWSAPETSRKVSIVLSGQCLLEPGEIRVKRTSDV